MDFLKWLEASKLVDAQADLAAKELRKITGDTHGGLTPDSVKATDEYKIAKRKWDNAFKAMRDFNSKAPKEYMRKASELRRTNK